VPHRLTPAPHTRYAKIIDGLSAQPILIGHPRGYRMTLATVALAPAYNPGPWSTFFVLTGTVAATLTGLFFVAFSLRVRDLQLSVVIRTRAAYLLTLLVVIVVYSAFVVMPGQSRAALAAEILIVSVVGVAYLCGWCLPAADSVGCVLGRSDRPVDRRGGRLAARHRRGDQHAYRERRRAVPPGVRGAAPYRQ
jgi:hypothetical protein